MGAFSAQSNYVQPVHHSVAASCSQDTLSKETCHEFAETIVWVTYMEVSIVMGVPQ